MKVILDIPEENLGRLGELAKFQKRSRKAFMEYVLISHAEQAENGYPETIAFKVTEMPQKSSQKKNVPKQAEVPEAQNETMDVGVEGEIERLNKAAASCSDTSLGRKAKAFYLKQIDNLKKQ